MVVKQHVLCKRPGCKGSCPEFVVLASRKSGDPATCRICHRTFKLQPGAGTYAEAAAAGAKAVAPAAKVAVIKAKGKPERSSGGAAPHGGEQDDLALALASLDSLRKAQSQGADVAGALLAQNDKVQRLRDAKLACKPAHVQLKQLDEQIGKKTQGSRAL